MLRSTELLRCRRVQRLSDGVQVSMAGDTTRLGLYYEDKSDGLSFL